MQAQPIELRRQNSLLKAAQIKKTITEVRAKIIEKQKSGIIEE
jgi:pyrimidine operon attenuation protein/uracil phosphoribosyltransferase